MQSRCGKHGGRQLARQLAPEKPKLALVARRMDALQAVAAQCGAAGAGAVAVTCDVGIEADRRKSACGSR
jgi:short-subunit dehydrogenase